MPLPSSSFFSAEYSLASSSAAVLPVAATAEAASAAAAATSPPHPSSSDVSVPTSKAPATSTAASAAPEAATPTSTATTPAPDPPAAHSIFPFLLLPYELRLQIYDYLLPHTTTLSPKTIRRAAGLAETPPPLNAWNIQSEFETPPSLRVPLQATIAAVNRAEQPGNNVIWTRGCTSILRVCRQVYDECAEVMYGGNTFVVRVSGNKGDRDAADDVGVRFQARLSVSWVLSSYGWRDFLVDFSLETRRRIRRYVIVIEAWHESICWSRWKGGFAHQVALLRRCVERLIGETQEDGLRSLQVHLVLKESVGLRMGGARRDSLLDDQDLDSQCRMHSDLQTVLNPFWRLTGVREAKVTGNAVGEELVDALVECLMAPGGGEASRAVRMQRSLAGSGRPFFGKGLREAGGEEWIDEMVH